MFIKTSGTPVFMRVPDTFCQWSYKYPSSDAGITSDGNCHFYYYIKPSLVFAMCFIDYDIGPGVSESGMLLERLFTADRCTWVFWDVKNDHKLTETVRASVIVLSM